MVAEIEKVDATTHDKWYGNLHDHTPTLDKWYDHMVIDKARDDKIKQCVMDGTIPLAVVDSGTTSNVGKYVDSLHLNGRPLHTISKYPRDKRQMPPKHQSWSTNCEN